MLFRQLTTLLVLAAQAAGSSALLLKGPQTRLEGGSSPRLGLFFSANISTACTGRCSLRASTAPCNGGNGTASAPAALEPWNSVLLSGGWQQQHLQTVVHIDCSDAACTPTPASFLAWHSDGDGSSACAQQAAAGLPPAPRLLPGVADSGDAVHMLNDGEPVVAVAYDPTAAPSLLVAMAHAALQKCERQLLTAAAGEASHGLAAATEPVASALLAAAEQDRVCQTRSLLLLRLAVAAWVLACTSVGAFL